MAKKIIKEPTIRHYSATCPICGCEFEFETTDARWHIRQSVSADYHAQRLTMQSNISCSVWCPSCDTCLEDMQTEIKE